MELSNEFDVPVPVEQAWGVLTDIERIAPCMPGAQLDTVAGDEYRGTFKVKVGPITAQYKGVARIVEQDDLVHSALIQASGRDTSGAGNASADIRAELVGMGETTHVSLLTDLTITGKVAQFGSGVLADVSAKLLEQFVANLEVSVLAEDLAELGAELELEALTTDDPVEAVEAAAAAEAAFDAAEAAVDLIDSTGPDGLTPAATRPEPELVGLPSEPYEAVEPAGAPVAKRVLTVAAVVTSLALIFGLGRRRRRRRRA
jgi:uncharacterized protein